jgi:hypothetical protein
MSTEGALTDERVIVEADGIGVLKQFETEEFSVPVIRYEIASLRDETVSIRLTDGVPEELSMDAISFHANYEPEHWTKYRSHDLEFERTIAPNEEVETVYGVKIGDRSVAEALLTEPEITEIRPEGDDLQLDSSTETVDGTTVAEIDSGDLEQLQDLISESPDGSTDRSTRESTAPNSTAQAGATGSSSQSGSTGSTADLSLETDSGKAGLDSGADGPDTGSDLDGLRSDSDLDGLGSDSDLDGLDSGSNRDGPGDGHSATSRDPSAGITIDLEDATDGSVDSPEAVGGTRSRRWESSQPETTDGLSGVTTDSDSPATVEFDWSDLPEDVRDDAIRKLTSDIELSVPLEAIVKQVVDRRLDELFDAIDAEALQQDVAATIAEEHLDTVGERIAAELADRDALAAADDATSGEPVDSVTLVVNGERYQFDDGETFGRRAEPWLDDLVEAAADENKVSYISSQHVQFSIEGTDAFVTDVSTNGTRLNDTTLEGSTEQLEDGDTLDLAGVATVDVEL